MDIKHVDEGASHSLDLGIGESLCLKCSGGCLLSVFDLVAHLLKHSLEEVMDKL